MDNKNTKPHHQGMTSKQKQFEKWKAFAESIELSKDDIAIIKMASNAMIDAIASKAYNNLMILFSTYLRIYKFEGAGAIFFENRLTETSNPKNVVGKYTMGVCKDKCKLKFSLLGADIKVIFEPKL